MLSRQVHLAGDPNWLNMLSHTQQQILQLPPTSLALPPDDTPLHDLHAILSEAFHAYVQQHHAEQAPRPHVTDCFQEVIENKWTHWKLLKQLKYISQSNLFAAWRHWTKFQHLHRTQAKVAKRRKLDKVADLTLRAGIAAQRSDLFGLYRLVNQFSPKQRRSRIQLRTAQGQIASPIEELAILRSYVQQIWYDETAAPAMLYCHPLPPGVPSLKLNLLQPS